MLALLLLRHTVTSLPENVFILAKQNYFFSSRLIDLMTLYDDEISPLSDSNC